MKHEVRSCHYASKIRESAIISSIVSTSTSSTSTLFKFGNITKDTLGLARLHNLLQTRQIQRNQTLYKYIYRKVPKISPGAYIFQRPFLRGVFLEGVIFGGAYLWRELNLRFKIDWASLLVGRKFTFFLLCFTLYLRATAKYKNIGGLIFGGAI